jgi:hypothetical protein
VLKKNPWIVVLSLAALVLSPALQAATASAAAAPAAAPAKATTTAPVQSAGSDKTDKADAGDDDTASTVGHKSPAIAGGLAFFPGVVIHGAGHMYAGSWMKGLGLLAVEGVSAAVVANSISVGADDIKSITSSASGGSGVKLPTDLSGGYTQVGIIVVGTMAFLWTWLDDMAGAPIAANEYNRIADQKSQTTLHLVPRSNGAQVALSTNF